MATLDELRDRRVKLQLQRESMTKRVRQGDKEVEYDLTQANAALRALDREIEAAERASSGRRKVRRVRIYSGKGL